MSSAAPPCRKVTVYAFRGDRSRAFATAFLKKLDQQKNHCGPGPSAIDYLLFAGHAGVSLDEGATIYGFNPDAGGLPLWQLMDQLRKGDAFPGIIRDDTSVFAAARNHGMTVQSFEVILPEPRYLEFDTRLDSELKNSQYSYGFPNGAGDCNCITWLERLGLPLLTGRMDEFISLPRIAFLPTRRFSECV